jgi:hypothetical protein
MVEAMLDYLESWLDQNIVQTLNSSGEPLSRLQHMCDRINEVYEGGKQPCLFAILLLGSARDVFHDRVKAIYRVWIDAIATVLIECGMKEELAQQRARDTVMAIQGSLIVSQALDDPSGFQRLMQHLPEELCNGTLP